MRTAADEQVIETAGAHPFGWRAVVQSLNRPYPVSSAMVALVMLVPLYLVIAEIAKANNPRVPATALDNLIPLRPEWAVVYGALYAFLIVIPVLVVRQLDHIRRTVYAYLSVWIISYVVFLAYPTVASRPDVLLGDGFAVWGLRFLYGADPPYNCFPSIHVAHSFVSALSVSRVHKHLGSAAVFWAALVALSTLFTKQHYVVDVVAGAMLAFATYIVFLRGVRRESIPERDRLLAPVMARAVLAVIGVGIGGFWVAYAVQRAAD